MGLYMKTARINFISNNFVFINKIQQKKCEEKHNKQAR